MKFILRFKEKLQLRGPQNRYSHGPAPLRVWETPPLSLMHTCPPNLTPFPLAEFFVVVRRKEEEKERERERVCLRVREGDHLQTSLLCTLWPKCTPWSYARWGVESSIMSSAKISRHLWKISRLFTNPLNQKIVDKSNG